MGIPITTGCSLDRLRLLATALEGAGEAVLVTDHVETDEPIIYANAAFSRLTGYAVDEVLGKNCAFLQNDDRQQLELKGLSDAVRAGHRHETVLRNYRKNGEPFLNRLSLTPIEDYQGRVTHFVGFLCDVTEQRQSLAALRASEARLRELFEQMHEGFYLSEAIRDASGRMVDFLFVDANPAVERLTGIPLQRLIAHSFRDALPNASDELIRRYAEVLDAGEPTHFEVQMPTLNNRWYEVRAQKIGRERFSVLFLEITARVAVEAALRDSETKFRTFAQAMPNHVWTTPAAGKIDWYNDKVYEYSGKTPGELDGDLWSTIVHPDDFPAALEAWRSARNSGGTYQTQFRLRGADGVYRWFISRALPMRDADGVVTRWIGTNTDIDAQKTEASQLDYLGSHDALTGLLNRRRILETLNAMVQASQHDGTTLAVLFIDLDQFKELNDAHGHTLGDRLLREIAHRFSALMAPTDALARIGGDEFLFISKAQDRRAAEDLAQRLLVAATAGFTVDGAKLSLGCSIGVAYYPDGGITADALLCNADFAMYEAKAAGRGVMRVFNPVMATDQLNRLRTSHELKYATVAEQMRLYYQPIFSLKTGRLNAAEALVRWQHPKRGLLGADQFVNILEESQGIVALGRWGLEQVCRRLVEWDRQGLHVPRINVNLAARHVVDAGLPVFVGGLLAQYRLDPKRLGVEVTESMLMSDVGVAVEVLGALHKMGICIALDDFGTGFSNLSYLQQFSFDSLKIDKSFVQAIGTEHEGNTAKLTQAVIAMSAALGLKTVAEGVETAAQRDFLQAQDCDAAQGFLFSPAVEARSFAEQFLAQRDPPLDIFSLQ